MSNPKPLADREQTALSVEEIEGRFAGTPKAIEPLIGLLKRHAAANGACLEYPGSVLLIGHRPEIAPRKYDIAIYQPYASEALERFESSRGFDLPKPIAELFAHMNGGKILELSIYGIPPSMLGDIPMLDRSTGNPFDLATANRSWRLEYEDADKDFLFGGRDIGWDEQVGYFLRRDGTVIARWNGKYRDGSKPGTKIRAEWLSFEDWLVNEPIAVETFQSRYLESCRRGTIEWDRQQRTLPARVCAISRKFRSLFQRD